MYNRIHEINWKTPILIINFNLSFSIAHGFAIIFEEMTFVDFSFATEEKINSYQIFSLFYNNKNHDEG